MQSLVGLVLDLPSTDVPSEMIERKPPLDAFGQLPGPIKLSADRHLSCNVKTDRPPWRSLSLEGWLGPSDRRQAFPANREIKIPRALVDALERSGCGEEWKGGGGRRGGRGWV